MQNIPRCGTEFHIGKKLQFTYWSAVSRNGAKRSRKKFGGGSFFSLVLFPCQLDFSGTTDQHNGPTSPVGFFYGSSANEQSLTTPPQGRQREGKGGKGRKLGQMIPVSTGRKVPPPPQHILCARLAGFFFVVFNEDFLTAVSADSFKILQQQLIGGEAAEILNSDEWKTVPG